MKQKLGDFLVCFSEIPIYFGWWELAFGILRHFQVIGRSPHFAGSSTHTCRCEASRFHEIILFSRRLERRNGEVENFKEHRCASPVLLAGARGRFLRSSAAMVRNDFVM